MGSRVWRQTEKEKEEEEEKEIIMASRSGGTPIRTNKVRSGPDQAFTLPKGTSAAPIKGKGMGTTKPKTKPKPKSKPSVIKTRPKRKETPKKKPTKKKNPNPRKRKKKKISWSKPTKAGAIAGTALTGAALVAMGRSTDKYRKYRK